MDLATVLSVHRLLTDHSFQYLIYGGWGLDIICGEQSRPHGDLDLFFWHRDYRRLRSVLAAHGFTGYELAGRQLVVKAPFRADMVFLDDSRAEQIVGMTSVFEVRVPRRGLRDWTYGVVEGHALPVGCVELVVRLSGHSPNSRPSDQALLDQIMARCDRRLLAEIEHRKLPYDDENVAWTAC
ncbi:nucleotidyltransferase domain-containing protein [Micromonospora purpureochromogenes]|uniref:Aminoglycoside-2''-adenylyltransferase n=1 Tax=Micromonospora purpureochromogenes TaxID=47872 RepID=A0ABX2RUV4_9ACTN|nr:hypothetical protein [Micromonospora purpureochromogenes]NYF59049.1 hypothetical protein [Micromonospora purpureochromogenes]